MVSTEILDCEGKFYGTMKQQWLRHGKPVAETKTALSDILMVQTRGANMESCAMCVSAGRWRAWNVARSATRATNRSLPRTMSMP